MKATCIKRVLIICILTALISCRKNEDLSKCEKRVLVNQITAFNGYKKSFDAEPVETLNYFQDLFKLYMLDEVSFRHTIKFLHEDGSELDSKQMNLEKIIESRGYKLTVNNTENPEYCYVRMLVNNKVNAQFFVKRNKIKTLSDIDEYRKTYSSFSAEFKQGVR